MYIVGVEDEQLPGWIARDEDPEHATQESRRLLYVGMTRAIDRLVLTRVDRRAGRPHPRCSPRPAHPDFLWDESLGPG